MSDDYGVADVVTDEFLPFEDGSFDLVVSTEAFYYVPDPEHGVRELRRVLRPGGVVVLTLPGVWEYDRAILEHRYTGPELEQLFRGWDDVEIIENGGRAVAWALLGGVLLRSIHRRVLRAGCRASWDRVFGLVYLVNNAPVRRSTAPSGPTTGDRGAARGHHAGGPGASGGSKMPAVVSKAAAGASTGRRRGLWLRGRT